MFSGINVTCHLIKDKVLYNIALLCVVLYCILVKFPVFLLAAIFFDGVRCSQLVA